MRMVRSLEVLLRSALRLERRFPAILAGLVVSTQVLAGDLVTSDGHQWSAKDRPGGAPGCYEAVDFFYLPVGMQHGFVQAALDRLALAALKRNDAKAGCVTTPFLETPYGVARLDAHAGLDLRVSKETIGGDPVYAITDGTVVHMRLCLRGVIDTVLCPSPDGAEHSVLILETARATHKVLYLHMRSFAPLTTGSAVKKGDLLGRAGNVGAVVSRVSDDFSTNAHLHLEFWNRENMQFCNGRVAAVDGGLCKGGRCSGDDLRFLVQHPTMAMMEIEAMEASTPNVLTNGTRLDLKGFGPLRVGMTMRQAEAAIHGPLTPILAEETCTHSTPVHGPKGLHMMFVDGRIARFELRGCQLKTLSGVELGTSEARAQEAYNHALEVTGHQYVDTWHYMTLVPRQQSDRQFRLVLETDGKAVVAIRAGKLPEVQYVEGCL